MRSYYSSITPATCNVEKLTRVTRFTSEQSKYMGIQSLLLNLLYDYYNYIIIIAYQPKIMIFENELNKRVAFECQDFVKYRRILIDNNLSWKHYIDQEAIKISQTVGLVSKLRYFVPRRALSNTFLFYITPYLT